MSMKKYLMVGMSALALCSTFMSCSHDDIMTYSGKINVIENYQQAFLTRFGQPAPNQDWGFGSDSTRATRALFSDTWSGIHADCKFDESVFDMAVPSGAVELTKGSFTDAEKKATVFSITGNGDFNFNYAFNIPAGAKIYVKGTVTSLNGVNYDGVVTFYNTGTLTFTGANGARHTVINTGTLTVTDYANIGDLYNKGALVLERGHNQYWPNEGGSADIPNEMHIYSDGEATIEMPDGGDLKAICDIHGTLTVGEGKYLKIQNSTKKYICGIISDNTVENTDGPLETSYVKADVFKFDGNPIYLLPGGHVDVTTLQVPNSGCHFYGAEGSTGLVEAINYEFGNKNDFTHTFSRNIYFKVNGGYVKVDNCYAMGQSHYFNTVADYLADTTHADEFNLAASRINAGNASGSAACGDAWTTGEPTTPEPDKNPSAVRIIAEDLTVSAGVEEFDFNDVVFDVEWLDEAGTEARITLLAAGGTLPLKVAGHEVHAEFGLSNTNQMINTGNRLAIELPTVSFDVKDEKFAKKAYNIPVEVYKGGQWVELFAEQGRAPSKIAVSKSFQWCEEREPIEAKYPRFLEWVSNPAVKWY